MKNEPGRAARFVKASRIVFGRILTSLMIVLLVIEGSMIGRTFQRQIMEYYIYYRGVLLEQLRTHTGLRGERYEHAFATWEEAERSRQQAAIDTGGDPADFLRETYIKEVPTGRYTTRTPQTESPAVGTTVNQTLNRANPANLERERQEAFDRGQKELTMSLKGGTSTSVPAFKTGTTTLPLKVSDGLKTYNATAKEEIAKVMVELEKMDPVTMGNEKKLIAQRQVETNPWCNSIVRSLKIKAPPLPDKMFAQLQPGDVLLIAPEKTLTVGLWTGYYINLFDKLSSWEWKSWASHTLIFLKEVKGVKLFLDNLPGEGPRIKTEDAIIKEYGARAIDIAQPLSKVDGTGLWTAARELGIKQITADLKKLGNPELVRRINKWTYYGLYGNDNMVCSEADRWVLIQAGLKIADTESPFKKLMGIYYGPANFYSDEQHFLVTPLEKLPKINDKR
jgi:hypothetical protein